MACLTSQDIGENYHLCPDSTLVDQAIGDLGSN